MQVLHCSTGQGKMPVCSLCETMQVVSAHDDGKQFDNEDAQLQLDKGTPRYV